MLLHHILTPALVFVAFTQKIYKWGFAIFVCFAFSNFLLNISRWAKDSITPQIITHSIFIIFILDWTINRIFYYNIIVTYKIIIAASSWIIKDPRIFAPAFFEIVFLTMIGILNFYWGL